MTIGPKFLDNNCIAELLAVEAEAKRPPIDRALRRAARLAHIWPEEAAELVRQHRSLTEFAAVGPYLEKVIRSWIADPPPIPKRPEIREGFLTMTEARTVLAKNSSWLNGIKGDLQMHTQWSDGSGSIEEMAEAADRRGYEYIAITDHSQGLKIAGGIGAVQLREQGAEIDRINNSLAAQGKKLRILRSIELNLDPGGRGDMEQRSPC